MSSAEQLGPLRYREAVREIVPAPGSGHRASIDEYQIVDALPESFTDESGPDVVTTDMVDEELLAMRNDGLLLRNKSGSYRVPKTARPEPAGEPITADEARESFETGHIVDIKLWQARGRDLATPKTDQATFDSIIAGGDLFMVGSAEYHQESHGDYSIPLSDPDASITRESDGSITVDIPADDENSGGRYEIRHADLTDDWTRPRPLVDAEGRQSPFDVGPRHYAEDPYSVDGAKVLAQEVHDPERGAVGSIFRGNHGWEVDYPGFEGDLEIPGSFKDPDEAADWVYQTTGGRGHWAVPQAVNVELPGLE